MAVMASQVAESAPPDQAPLKAASVPPATENRNGTLEVNGHSSPDKEDLESITNHKDVKQRPSESVETNHKPNSDAFSANQQVSIDEKKEDQDVQDVQDKSIAEPIDSSGTKEKSASEDADVPDAPAPESAPKSAPESAPKPATVADEKVSSEQKVDEKMTESEEAQQEGAKIKPDEKPTDDAETAAESATVEPVTQPANEKEKEKAPTEPAPSEPKEDVVMSDAAPQPDEPSSTTKDKPDESKDVSPGGPAPITPVEEANTQPSISAVVESSQASTAAPATADTSMSDAPAPAKVAREREDDALDEPSAKRPKVDTATAEGAEAKVAAKGEPMEVEPADNTQSLYLANGEPKQLGDPSLDDTDITEWQTKCIRGVLSGVKKTKAGMHFRLPVKELWPGVWADYCAKVTDPTDIHTMELRLKGELPRYKTMRDFKQDLDRLVNNAVLFNGETHDIAAAARSTKDSILQRMQAHTVVELAKPEKKETPKHHAKRIPEPRAAAQAQAQPATPQAAPAAPAPAPPPPTPTPAPAARRQSKGAATSPTETPIEAAVFAIPPNNNGVPIIRRDSTKTADKPKRTINPPKSKDLPYESKKRKKLSPELRFCETVLEELKKSKYWNINNAFLQPVDPVALNIPNYHKVIKKPMDLGTMTGKLDRGEYSNAKEFEKDFNLIVKNCRDFNGEGHVVTDQANGLMTVFKKQWAQKDDFVSKHSAATTQHGQGTSSGPASRAKDETEDEDAESEPEPEPEEATQTSALLTTFQKRLEEEQKKVDAEMNSLKPDASVVAVAQAVISSLQFQIIQERNRLNKEGPKKPAKPKSTKAKKAGGGGAGAGGGKKAAPAGGAAAAGSKKSGGKKSGGKRKIGSVEKDIVTSGIGDLENKDLEKAIDIIKKDTGQGENDSGELELDIEALSDDAVGKLYDIVVKVFPGLKAAKEKEHREKAQSEAGPPAAPAPTPSKAKGGSKGKKNKPMSKAEQERKIQHLTQLRAAAQRQGSGSQEPMESIEGNGNAPAPGPSELAPEPDQDSEDEESSEEE